MDTATSDIRAVEFTPSSDGDSPVLPELLDQIPGGEEIGTVIEGKVLIRIEGTTYLLNEGDSYVIDTIKPHTFINPTDGITRIVSAHTPTTY